MGIKTAVFCATLVANAQSLGTFSMTGSLTTPRTQHTATLLTNGKVLIAGGFAILAGWPVWSSAELYDPVSRSFSLIAGMASPRFGHTATLLPDGRVLIAGGIATVNGGSFGPGLSSAELYDPSTGAFTPTGALTVSRAHHTATLLNSGKVLITGGYTQDATGHQVVHSSAELYDPSTGTFTATGSMAAARGSPVAVLLPNGKVLIEGGFGCGDEPNPELYDPTAGVFSLTGSSSDPSLGPVAASLLPNGDVLTTLALGCDVGYGAELYHTSSGTFAATPSHLTTWRTYSTATLLPEGKVLIDGRDYNHSGGSSELYEPMMGIFTATKGQYPQSEEGHTATLLPDGTVLLAGGWICCGFSVANAEIYAPAVLTPSPTLYTLPDGISGAIRHASTGQVVSAANPAVAGETLELYGAGLSAGSLVPPQVSVGARSARVVFFGDAPGYPGLNQINLVVPDGIAAGAVPVRMDYLARPSNQVTLAIR
jgi:hypothetical protein